MADQAIGFIGGAFHNVGLTFLPMNVWFWLLVVGEITAGALFVLGVFTRVAAAIVVVVMLGAMHTKGRSAMTFIDKDFMLAIIAIVIAMMGNGAYSLQRRCCRTCTGTCETGTKVKTPMKK